MWGFPNFFIPRKFEKFQLYCQFNGKTPPSLTCSCSYGQAAHQHTCTTAGIDWAEPERAGAMDPPDTEEIPTLHSSQLAPASWSPRSAGAASLGRSAPAVLGSLPRGVPAAGSPLLLGTNHRNDGTSYFHCCAEKVNYFQAGIKLTPPEVYII